MRSIVVFWVFVVVKQAGTKPSQIRVQKFQHRNYQAKVKVKLTWRLLRCISVINQSVQKLLDTRLNSQPCFHESL